MAQVNQAAFAALHGVSRKTVTAWKARGWLVLQGDQVDVDASNARLKKYRREGLPVVTPVTFGANLRADIFSAAHSTRPHPPDRLAVQAIRALSIQSPSCGKRHAAPQMPPDSPVPSLTLCYLLPKFQNFIPRKKTRARSAHPLLTPSKYLLALYLPVLMAFQPHSPLPRGLAVANARASAWPKALLNCLRITQSARSRYSRCCLTGSASPKRTSSFKRPVVLLPAGTLERPLLFGFGRRYGRCQTPPMRSPRFVFTVPINTSLRCFNRVNVFFDRLPYGLSKALSFGFSQVLPVPMSLCSPPTS